MWEIIPDTQVCLLFEAFQPSFTSGGTLDVQLSITAGVKGIANMRSHVLDIAHGSWISHIVLAYLATVSCSLRCCSRSVLSIDPLTSVGRGPA